MRPTPSTDQASTSPPVARLRTTRPVSQTHEKMPNSHVENAGVRWRGSTSPSFGGNARCIAIDSDVRAAGRIVVWQLAAEEVSTAMIRSFRAMPTEARAAEDEVAGRRQHVVGVVR